MSTRPRATNPNSRPLTTPSSTTAEGMVQCSTTTYQAMSAAPATSARTSPPEIRTFEPITGAPRSRELRTGPGQEDRAQQVVASEQLGGGTGEAHFAALQEEAAVGQGHRPVDALLDQDDRGAGGVDGAHDLHQAVHRLGREA